MCGFRYGKWNNANKNISCFWGQTLPVTKALTNGNHQHHTHTHAYIQKKVNETAKRLVGWEQNKRTCILFGQSLSFISLLLPNMLLFGRTANKTFRSIFQVCSCCCHMLLLCSSIRSFLLSEWKTTDENVVNILLFVLACSSGRSFSACWVYAFTRIQFFFQFCAID